MREQGGVTEVNSIGVEAPGSLGLCAHSHQVVNTFLLLVFCWVFLQNNSGNLHQILLSRYYFRKEPNQRIRWKACPGKGYPGGSGGKESTYNAGHQGSTPGSGSSPGVRE